MPDIAKENQTVDAKPAGRLSLALAIVALIASSTILAFSIYVYFNSEKTFVPTVAGPRTPASTASVPAIKSVAVPSAVQAANISDNSVSSMSLDNEANKIRIVADTFFSQGRLAEAAAQYQILLDKHPQSSEAKAALYGFARSTTQLGRNTEAAEAFKKYLAFYPNDALKANSLFQLGLTYKKLGNWNEAIANFQKYQALQPDQMPLDGYAYFEIAESYNSALKPQQAIEAYKNLATAPASALTKVTALERVAESYIKANNPAEAAVWYGKMLEVSKMPDYRATLMLKQTRAYSAAGQTTQATQVARQLLTEYLNTPSGFTNLKELYIADSPLIDEYYRGYYRRQIGEVNGSNLAFALFLGRPNADVAQTPIVPNLPLEMRERLAQAWFYLADNIEDRNEQRAVAEYRSLLAVFPQSKVAPQIIRRLAQLNEEAGNLNEVFKLHVQILQQFPNHPLTEESLAAQIRLNRLRGPDAIAPIIDDLVQRFPTSARRNQLYYDLGKAYQAVANTEKANLAFQKVAASPNVDFYVARAVERLKNNYDPNYPPRSTTPSHPSVYNQSVFQNDFERDRIVMENWLGTWLDFAAVPTSTINRVEIQDVRTRLAQDGAVKRMINLQELGESYEASREAREMLDRIADNPLEVYVLAMLFYENGEYYYSMAAAKRLLVLYQEKNTNLGLRDTPLLLQKLIYPLPYQNLVLEQANRFGFDPLLFTSLMRQESSFDPDATSGAGARGLTQVMPATGQGIAESLKHPNFDPNALYQPYNAIEYGAYYLSNCLKLFGGNSFEALAAYNGGAGNVYRWSGNYVPEQNFDQWVLSIDFAETRGYVQITYANYFLYRLIYGVS